MSASTASNLSTSACTHQSCARTSKEQANAHVRARAHIKSVNVGMRPACACACVPCRARRGASTCIRAYACVWCVRERASERARVRVYLRASGARKWPANSTRRVCARARACMACTSPGPAGSRCSARCRCRSCSPGHNYIGHDYIGHNYSTCRSSVLSSVSLSELFSRP